MLKPNLLVYSQELLEGGDACGHTMVIHPLFITPGGVGESVEGTPSYPRCVCIFFHTQVEGKING